jgi:hypothetical protein
MSSSSFVGVNRKATKIATAVRFEPVETSRAKRPGRVRHPRMPRLAGNGPFSFVIPAKAGTHRPTMRRAARPGDVSPPARGRQNGVGSRHSPPVNGRGSETYARSALVAAGWAFATSHPPPNPLPSTGGGTCPLLVAHRQSGLVHTAQSRSRHARSERTSAPYALIPASHSPIIARPAATALGP